MMDLHERQLMAFLAGDRDGEAGRTFDEHLIGCEQCWSAIREDRLGRAAASSLRESASPGLADRIALAIEIDEPPRARRRRVSGLSVWTIAAAAAFVAVLLAVVVPSARSSESATIAAVLHSAQQLPSVGSSSGSNAAAVLIGEPTTLTVGDAQLVLTRYRLGTVELLVARSDRDFPTPNGARVVRHGAMPWVANRGPLTLYCPAPRVIVAGPVSVTELPSLAARLPVQ
jgi:hypothetical protein